MGKMGPHIFLFTPPGWRGEVLASFSKAGVSNSFSPGSTSALWLPSKG